MFYFLSHDFVAHQQSVFIQELKQCLKDGEAGHATQPLKTHSSVGGLQIISAKSDCEMICQVLSLCYMLDLSVLLQWPSI
jgi:hypothetical protein